MKVNVYPVDNTGTGNYRLRFPAQALIKQGYDVEIRDDEILSAIFQNSPDGDIRLVEVDMSTVPDCDVVVLQRVASPTLCLVIEWLVDHGYKVVVDSDDDIHSISHGNLAKGEWRGKERIWSRANRAASGLTCSTTRLQIRGGGILLPNCVPDWYLGVEVEQDNSLGWTGTMEVHPFDLQMVGDAVKKFTEQSGMDFRVVGIADGVGEALGIGADPPETGWVPIDEYPHLVAQMRMGIVPLEGSSFNDSKSWLKGLEYAALGVPFVASPTAEYNKLAQMGCGVIASRPREWVRELHRVRDQWDEYRDKNRAVAAQWTYESRAEAWWSAWMS